MSSLSKFPEENVLLDYQLDIVKVVCGCMSAEDLNKLGPDNEATMKGALHITCDMHSHLNALHSFLMNFDQFQTLVMIYHWKALVKSY